MIKTAIIGLGKMGLSHCSIVNAQKNVDLVAVCDTSSFVLTAMKKYTNMKCYKDYKKMIKENDLQAVIIATPTKFHYEMTKFALENNLHVFVEKPLCLNLEHSYELVHLAKEKNVVNQVGYHYRFVFTFKEAKRLVEKGVIGEVYHVFGEAYGPVMLRKKSSTWRTTRSEGGGCLYDYASHVINLIDFILGPPDRVGGTILKKIYSEDADDAVYTSLFYNSGITGQISVNWSDPSYRKMYVKLTLMGTKGKIIVDPQECKIYLTYNNPEEKLQKGWNIKYLTDLLEPIQFYLRGEEYSLQIEYFFKCIEKGETTNNVNSFAEALKTDIVIDMIIKNAFKGN